MDHDRVLDVVLAARVIVCRLSIGL